MEQRAVLQPFHINPLVLLGLEGRTGAPLVEVGLIPWRDIPWREEAGEGQASSSDWPPLPAPPTVLEGEFSKLHLFPIEILRPKEGEQWA